MKPFRHPIFSLAARRAATGCRKFLIFSLLDSDPVEVTKDEFQAILESSQTLVSAAHRMGMASAPDQYVAEFCFASREARLIPVGDYAKQLRDFAENLNSITQVTS